MPRSRLQSQVRQRRPVAGPAEEAFLNLLRTAFELERLREEPARAPD